MNRRALLASLAAGSMGGRFGLVRGADVAHRRVGIFSMGDCGTLKARWEKAGLFKTLADLGHVEGRNLTVEWRCFGMDFSLAPKMAAELVRQRMDVLVTMGTPHTRMLQEATKTIPIVTRVGDPVASGFSKSHVRPEGNITGLCFMHPDARAKHVELIRRMVPKLDRLVIIGEARYPGMRQLLVPEEVAAKAAGLVAEVRLVDQADLEHVFIDMKRFAAAAALLTFSDKALTEVAAKLALRHRVPTMYDDMGYVEHGGLMSFSLYYENDVQRTAVIIDKLLRGAKPAQIPWELPDRSHLAINRRTAKLLGLAIPPDLLVLADQVVE